jgi:hypothetical protein
MRPFPAFISPANRSCPCMLCLTYSFNSCLSGTTRIEQKKDPNKPKGARRMETYTGGGRCGLSLLLFLLQTVLVLAYQEQQQQSKRRSLTSQKELGRIGVFLLRITVDVLARITLTARPLKSPRYVKKNFRQLTQRQRQNIPPCT